MTSRRFVTGVAGPTLSAAERAFLRGARPWGLIIFSRNISSPEQLIELVESFRDCVGWQAPVFVDQEGGRVQRLAPPYWPAYPAGARYGTLYDRDGSGALTIARLAGRLIAADLHAVSIDVNCLPVADIPAAGSDPVIGDRAYGSDPDKVAAIAAALAEGLMAGGVLPVLDAPRAALEATDFAAFRPLAGLPLGMTAHVVFSALDPVAPATTSVTMVRDVIRGFIGFRGLLMTDDISMGALSGTIAARAKAALAAGCDIVLHCNGDLREMSELAEAVPVLAGESALRAEAALARRRAPEAFDADAARRILAQALAEARPNAGMIS